MGRKKIAIEKIQDSRLRVVTLNKRKKGLIKKAMEISLLTGVHLVLTIFDKEEGKIIQYLSDSMNKFKAINQLDEIKIRKRYVKDPQKQKQGAGTQNKDGQPPPEEDVGSETEAPDGDGLNSGAQQQPTGAPKLYIDHKIVSEIYTNDHYEYLFNNVPMPDGLEVVEEDDRYNEFSDRESGKKKCGPSKKTSQYYRLKPPPKGMIQCSKDIRNLSPAGGGAAAVVDQSSLIREQPDNQIPQQNSGSLELDSEKIDKNGQRNLKAQLDFIHSVSNPQVKDQEPIVPDAPIEKQLQDIQQNGFQPFPFARPINKVIKEENESRTETINGENSSHSFQNGQKEQNQIQQSGQHPTYPIANVDSVTQIPKPPQKNQAPNQRVQASTTIQADQSLQQYIPLSQQDIPGIQQSQVSPQIDQIGNCPSLPSGSSMTGAFPTNGLSSGFLNHFIAQDAQYQYQLKNTQNILSPIDIEKNSETQESKKSKQGKAFSGGFGAPYSKSSQNEGAQSKQTDAAQPKQTVKDNIMKLIRKRLNETRVASGRAPLSKAQATDKMNISGENLLSIPVNKQDDDSVARRSEDQSQDSVAVPAEKTSQKESTKTAKFLDQILLEDQDDLSKEKAKWEKLYQMIQDKGPNNKEVADALGKIQRQGSQNQKKHKQMGLDLFEKNLRERMEQEKDDDRERMLRELRPNKNKREKKVIEKLATAMSQQTKRTNSQQTQDDQRQILKTDETPKQTKEGDTNTKSKHPVPAINQMPGGSHSQQMQMMMQQGYPIPPYYYQQGMKLPGTDDKLHGFAGMPPRPTIGGKPMLPNMPPNLLFSKMQAQNQMYLGMGMSGMYPQQMMYNPYVQGSSSSTNNPLANSYGTPGFQNSSMLHNQSPYFGYQGHSSLAYQQAYGQFQDQEVPEQIQGKNSKSVNKQQPNSQGQPTSETGVKTPKTPQNKISNEEVMSQLADLKQLIMKQGKNSFSSKSLKNMSKSSVYTANQNSQQRFENEASQSNSEINSNQQRQIEQQLQYHTMMAKQIELEGQASSAFSFNKSLRANANKQLSHIKGLNIQTSPKAHSHMRSKSKQDVHFNLFNNERDRLSQSNRNMNNSGYSINNIKKLVDTAYQGKFDENEIMLNKMKSKKSFKDQNYSKYSQSGGHHERKQFKQYQRDMNQMNIENIQQKLTSLPSDKFLMSLKIAQQLQGHSEMDVSAKSSETDNVKK